MGWEQRPFNSKQLSQTTQRHMSEYQRRGMPFGLGYGAPRNQTGTISLLILVQENAFRTLLNVCLGQIKTL